MPTTVPVFASNYAIKKMKRGQYVELWYYTNHGLDEAMRMSTTVDKDTMVMSYKPDRSSSWVSAAAAQDSDKVVDDKEILWEDFCQAVPCMLLAMEEADWPVECIIMLASFWANLQVHELGSS